MFLALFLVLSLCRPGVSKRPGAPVMLLSLPTVIVAANGIRFVEWDGVGENVCGKGRVQESRP